MDLRTKDNLDAMIGDYIAKNTLDLTGWRVKWRGKFVVMRSGNSLWNTKGKASSGFKSSMRNDRHFIWEYMKIKTGDPNLDWSKVWRDSSIHKEVIEDIMKSGDVEFVEIKGVDFK